ncbi:hypothetical protein E1180_11420 [Roseibium denhamense]|uniref:VCBS repeat-containing protein n=1 Tax=Roseibium denhamense TaxID=76305 RepID=A0ABY1N5U7_9HYPH|nr:hypothetical protein [Roseibium denhamense]MTI06122.1 hypothetical protein [Roseibium denhamense]SMP01059.1 hypothetical protein SAMN06265374_0309 [Roseibium denhamense]
MIACNLLFWRWMQRAAVILGSLFICAATGAAFSKDNPSARLPDGNIAKATLGDEQISAWYGSPTTRYAHGILGDATEAGSLHVEVNSGPTLSHILPQDEVFEDRTPRLVDLDGDGVLEIITIRSYRTSGGSLAVFGVRNNTLTELAKSEPIGRANRWLNIAEVGDFAERGNNQIAFVETPHIGGTLHLAEWQGNRLVTFHSLGGFSNHKIGSREQDLSGTIFFNDDRLPDLAVPSDNRRVLRIAGVADGKLQELHRFELPSPVARRADIDYEVPQNCIHFDLENGERFDLCLPYPEDR